VRQDVRPYRSFHPSPPLSMPSHLLQALLTHTHELAQARAGVEVAWAWQGRRKSIATEHFWRAKSGQISLAPASSRPQTNGAAATGAVVVVESEAEAEEIALERGNLGDDACVCMFRMHLCAEL